MIKQEKINEWVVEYLTHIKDISTEVHVQQEEGYKFKAVDNFQKNFNIEAQNLVEMLEKAIANNNLVVGSWYFPKKMLLIFATDYKDQTRAALRDLFNETKSIKDRIDDVRIVFDGLMGEINKKTGEKKHHFMGVRFLSLLLAYRFPNKYNALKPREWRTYCKYIDNNFSMPKKITKGEQYEIFQPYIESLRQYILKDSRINELRLELTKGLNFHDDEFRWMTQDIIYVTTGVIDGEYGSSDEEKVPKSIQEVESSEDEGKRSVTIDDKFALEEDLEQFIIDNFENLDFQTKLSIYTDSSGKQGVYYGTNSGEIDILAIDQEGNFVVIELKRGRANNDAMSQLGGYMHWVNDNLAKGNKTVRGIIIAHKYKKSLLDSLKALKYPVTILQYKLKIDLTECIDQPEE